MRDANTVTVVGRLTRDVDIRTLASGNDMAMYSIANNYARKAGDSWTTDANFFDCEQFRGFEGVLPYLTKGKQVSVTGILRQDRWIGTDGMNRSKIKIIVQHLQLLGSTGNDTSQFPESRQRTPVAATTAAGPFPTADSSFDDDVPF